MKRVLLLAASALVLMAFVPEPADAQGRRFGVRGGVVRGPVYAYPRGYYGYRPATGLAWELRSAWGSGPPRSGPPSPRPITAMAMAAIPACASSRWWTRGATPDGPMSACAK